MPETRIHLIGICGTAMATLAALLKRKGFDVRGSDQDVYPPMSDFLESEGIPVASGYKSEHITGELDQVIVGNAISRGNPELEAVLDRKIRYCSLPEAIREHFLWGARSIVIAGTHGKTTTTALTGWVLTAAGLDPSVLVGGIARNFGTAGSSYQVGQGRDFVIEGDEYDSAFFDKTAKFLKYLPDICVINNVEFNHADIYADLDAVMLAFRRLVNLVPRKGLVLLGADSANALALKTGAVSPVATFGMNEDADWQADEVTAHGTSTRFHVRRQGKPYGTFEVPLLGLHNVRNTLAAIAVAAEVGIDPEKAARGLRAFSGVKRRLEVVGTADGVTIFDDFAHHPTAIAETLAGLRAANPSVRIWGVFEPRSASSCRRVFQDDFAAAFAPADEVLIAPVFRSKLPESERLSVRQLVRDLRARGQSARETSSIDDIIDIVSKEHKTGNLVVLMSNGGFGGIHAKLLQALPVTSTIPAIVDAGDSALVAAFEERIDPVVNDLAIGLARRLRAARLDGVRDIVPAFHTVTVHFDPLVVNREELRARLAAPALPSATASAPGRHHDVPVHYDGEDLPAVAEITGLTERQVADAHSATTYRVFMLGFLPGFAYMGLLDTRIAVPRRATPRMRVPAGSVAIAGGQTGIYPMDSPGGWHLIGRTSLRPYDPNSDRPFLFSTGDTVRFVPE